MWFLTTKLLACWHRLHGRSQTQEANGLASKRIQWGHQQMRTIFRVQRVRLLLVEHVQAAGNEDDDDALITLLVTLPTRVANAVKSAPPCA